MSGIIEGILPPAMFTIGYALFVACFFCRDMLYLRTLAVVGQIALIPYYIDPSAQFDWGPYVGISCTAILVCVNFFYICVLLAERRPVRLTPVERSMYDAVFSSLPLRAYRNLFRLGDITRPEGGELLIRRGTNIDNLYLVIDGEVEVVLDSGVIKGLTKGSFIGELSFITGQTTSADVRVKGPQTTLLSWEKEKLVGSLDNDRVLSNAFDLIINTDVTGKLQRMNTGPTEGSG